MSNSNFGIGYEIDGNYKILSIYPEYEFKIIINISNLVKLLNKFFKKDYDDIRKFYILIKSELTSVSAHLEDNDSFNSEFWDFLEISDMIEYTVLNELDVQKEFILNLIGGFINLIINRELVGYCEMYDGFKRLLNKHSEYFYTEICDIASTNFKMYKEFTNKFMKD